MVDEVLAHVKEILEAGAICPSQAHGVMQLYWCARKSVLFIDFYKLNARTKKDS